jgi:hypothetical protein
MSAIDHDEETFISFFKTLFEKGLEKVCISCLKKVCISLRSVVQQGGFVRRRLEQQEHSGVHGQVASILLD